MQKTFTINRHNKFDSNSHTANIFLIQNYYYMVSLITRILYKHIQVITLYKNIENVYFKIIQISIFTDRLVQYDTDIENTT